MGGSGPLLRVPPDLPLARVQLQLEGPSDEDPPKSQPESFSPTMTASLPSPPGDPFFDTPEFDTPATGDSPVTAQEPVSTYTRRLEEIWSISSYSSSNSNTCTSSSLAATIEYVESPVQHSTWTDQGLQLGLIYSTATYDHADDHGIGLHLAEQK